MNTIDAFHLLHIPSLLTQNVAHKRSSQVGSVGSHRFIRYDLMVPINGPAEEDIAVGGHDCVDERVVGGELSGKRQRSSGSWDLNS
jgi:hypothetical protein